MDELTLFTPCRCAACGREVTTGGHDCQPSKPSVFEGIVRLGLRRRVIAALARMRKGRR